MRVRVLGCSGAIARDCKTTSFLVDQDVLIDAGTGVGDLTREEMLRIEDVFLTHAHLDHIACLPLMVDTIAGARAGQPLRVHALPHTLAALRQHVFNDLIWPDFTRLPSAAAPLVTFHPLDVGAVRHVQGRAIEALPAEHSVPAVGFAVRGPQADAPWWVFSGDTVGSPAFWQRVNQLHVHSLVIETAFSNGERALAQLARHLSPAALADQLDQIDPARRYPIYITHTKPAETETIMREIAQFDQVRPPRREAAHDIRWPSAGHVFEL
ncbi:3',5'-cyclic-nucleotide phosphodiesterase [Ottowia beijingensis]|uniref:3',5'-cyclic-nucleotide phosphodiesterase n=1 Tax=Ottowia beijingensis TaxID=1207057 RepID=UPI00362C61D0